MAKVRVELIVDIPDTDDALLAMTVLDRATFTVSCKAEDGEEIELNTQLRGYRLHE